MIDKRRGRVEADLADAIYRRVHLGLMRPLVPNHAHVEKTDLTGKLVRHTGELKTVVDTVRVVCANVEADLASVIAPHLRRPKEAKKVISNLFAAPELAVRSGWSSKFSGTIGSRNPVLGLRHRDATSGPHG